MGGLVLLLSLSYACLFFISVYVGLYSFVIAAA